MPYSDFNVLKHFSGKRIPKNRMENWMWNSCVNSPELTPLDYYVWENIRGQSQVPLKISYSELDRQLQHFLEIAELKEMLQLTVE